MNSISTTNTRQTVSLVDAQEILLVHYGRKTKEIKELKSNWNDLNFLVVCELEHSSHFDGEQEADNDKYVLKIHRIEDPIDVEVIKGQHCFMQHLSQKGFVCPTTVSNIHGSFVTITKTPLEGVNGCEQLPMAIHLLSFLPGQELLSIPATEEVLYTAGKMLADIHLASKDFSCPVFTSHSEDPHKIDNALELRGCLHVIQDTENLALVKDILQSFEHKILPKIQQLDKGIIHGDFHDENIIILNREEMQTELPYSMKYGIIDFGDMCSSAYIFDLATTVAYFMLENTVMDFLDAGRHIVDGYQSIKRLVPLEEEVLYLGVCVRYCQHIVYGQMENDAQGGGNGYTVRTNETGWFQLKELWKTPKEIVYNAWKCSQHCAKRSHTEESEFHVS